MEKIDLHIHSNLSDGNYDIPFTNGESINDLNNRLYSFINEICN